MNNPSVNPIRPAVKPPRPLRPIGELIALFPELNPERFFKTFDQYALGLIQVEKLVLAADARLPWPPDNPVDLAVWLRDNEVGFLSQTFLRTERRGRWYGRYKIILGIAPEVRRD